MIVYQTNFGGYYIGTTTADESPLEPGVFHIPGGCTTMAPPQYDPVTEVAHWDGDSWTIEPAPEPEPETNPNPVPEVPGVVVVARHQGLLALLDSQITEPMIRDGIEKIVDAYTREVARIRFEQPFWYDNSEFIDWGKTYFNLTDEDVKNLFALARTK